MTTTLKRRFDALNTPESSTPPRPSHSNPPPKRRLVSSGPFIFSSPSTAASTSNTPHSSYSYNYTPPSDSPTNPFGRIRKLALTSENLTLPRATSFSKHLPLRMQIVHIGAKTHAKPQGEGTHRIVQVPLNYTFRHLRKLLDFLFTPDTSGKAPKAAVAPPVRRSTRSTRVTAVTTKPVSVAVPAIGPPPAPTAMSRGHLFEVQDSICMYKTAGSVNLKPGHIRSARTWAKLSSVHDPFRVRRAEDDGDEEDGNENGNINEGQGEGDDEWIWEAEEDFTLGHVWPEGGDLSRGVTYHHSSTIQIHITINTSKIPGRKGVGNKPFVFVAYGRGFSHLPGQNEEEEFDFDAPVERVEASRWNSHEAFDRYLVREGERENVNGPKPDATVDVEDGFDPDKSDMMMPSLFSSSPFVLPAQTPLPPTRLHRLRVQYASRRMERLNKKGMDDLVDEVGLGDEDEDGEGTDQLREDEEQEIC